MKNETKKYSTNLYSRTYSFIKVSKGGVSNGWSKAIEVTTDYKESNLVMKERFYSNNDSVADLYDTCKYYSKLIRS
tara:strand:+ start:263 stop:490 length:228 start_codon:yes stop_codon:yes gene_type:complete